MILFYWLENICKGQLYPKSAKIMTFYMT